MGFQENEAGYKALGVNLQLIPRGCLQKRS